MRGFEQTGAVAWIDRHALALVQAGSAWSVAGVVSGGMAVLSNLISNVPAGVLWGKTLPPPPHPPPAGGALAVGSPLGGHPAFCRSPAEPIRGGGRGGFRPLKGRGGKETCP